MRGRGAEQDSMEAALLQENLKCDPRLEEEEVKGIAKSIAKYSPNPESSEKGLTKNYADALLKDHFFPKDVSDRLYNYRSSCYRAHGENAIKRLYQAMLEELGRTKHWNVRRRTEIIEYIRDQAPVLWERPPSDVINVENGLLNAMTRDLQPHTPDHLSIVHLPIKYDPTAECPAGEIFVSEVFPRDAQDVAWEMVARLMTPDTSLQKAVMLAGDGANGKSTWLTPVIAFLGRENVSALSLQKIENDRFGPVRLLGKLANICPDLPTAHLTSTSTFKAVVGGNMIPAEKRFRDSFEFIPFARLVFSTNEPPESDDASYAFMRRWIVIPFDNTFEENKIAKDVLAAQLSDPIELSGVLNKAIDALPHIRERGISVSESMKQAFEAFQEATEPIAVWLANNTVQSSHIFLPKGSLYSQYKKEAADTISDRKFGKRVREIFPNVKGHVSRYWQGLGMRRDQDD